MKNLSIIIVSYNTARLLKQCLDSIEKHLAGKVHFSVYVVDNNSSDGSQSMLCDYKKDRAWLEVDFLPLNTGFSYANNVGIRKSDGDYILLLNSDTYLIDDSLCHAIMYLDESEKIFGCGCCLVDEQMRPGVSYGEFPSLWTVVKEIAANRFCGLRAIVPESGHPDIIPIDFPCGAFFLIKRVYLDKTGLLDESFFMYFEETDLALRAKRMGYEIVLMKNVRIVHLGGASSPPDKALQRQTLLYNSWMKYTVKNHGVIASFFLKTMLTAYFAFLSRLRLNSSQEFKMHEKALANGWKHD
jgi:N-acetylglucosaminyl-diphospho-decaprenol L-rhamnosyltransferase